MRKSILTMSNFNIGKSNTVLIIVMMVATSLTEAITIRQAEVLVNESVSITCFSEEVKHIQWHLTPPGKSNIYVYAGGKFYPPYDTGRFRLDNNSTANMYTLVITDIIHEDAGLYELKDDVLSGVFGSTHLTVLDSSLVCTSNMHPNGFVGPNTCNIEQENMTFNCAVSFSGNSPKLMWSTLNGSQALNSSICESKDNRTNCSLSVKADPSFDRSTFICQSSNDARFNCSIEDVRVEYFLGEYKATEKKVGDNVTCLVTSNLQIHYNWTIQQNNQYRNLNGNQTIYYLKPGFYECSVKYNIRNVTCYAPIVDVNVSNIIDDKETDTKSSNDFKVQIAIGVSIAVSLCLVAVIIAFVLYTKCKCCKGNAPTSELPLKKKANFGVDVAYIYFFSYLQIVLPGVWNSFSEEIQRPSAVIEPTGTIFLVKKLLIIIPKTLLSPLKLTDVPNFRRTDLSIKQCFDRAGKERREYTVPIYKLIDKESENVYYFVTDIPSCLYAIREAYDSELSTLSRSDVIEIRDDFIQTLKELLNHTKNFSKFANQWELLLWPDNPKDKNRMELSKFVSQQIKSKDLAVKFADILNQPITGEPTPDHDQKPGLSLKMKANFGVGVAYTYFFSYLQIVLPDVWNKLVTEIWSSPAVKEPNEKTFLVKKMLIIIPKTLQSSLRLSDYANFERTKLSIKQCFDRAGKEKREYTVPIYELTDKESGNVYNFVTDLPSCLYAIREAYDSELSTMSENDVFKTRDNFVQTVTSLLNHPENRSKFENQWELLLWPDDDDVDDEEELTTMTKMSGKGKRGKVKSKSGEDHRLLRMDKNLMELSKFVSHQIKSKDLAVKLADILKQPIPGELIPDSSVLASESKPTFAYAGGIRAYPPYSEGPHYDLKNNPRGYCIIINNFEFPGLERRPGAAAEIEALKKLFEGLKFKVDARENLTTKEMINCLIEYRNRDHSKSDAFVCCLLSHGEKGRIYATDGLIFVIRLLELFYAKNCPGLAEKPKLFFIGTCQGKAEDEKNVRMKSTSAEHNPPDTGSGTDNYGQLSREAKQDNIFDIRPGTDSGQPLLSEGNPDLHDSIVGGPYVQCEDKEDFERELVPSGVCFIVSYACLPETIAWHDSNKGGLYVQALCKHLNQDLEIDVALRHVSQEVQNLLNTYDKEGIKYSRQDPFHIITPPQKFLFLGPA